MSWIGDIGVNEIPFGYLLHSHGKIHPFLSSVNHLFLWAIYTMANCECHNQRVNGEISGSNMCKWYLIYPYPFKWSWIDDGIQMITINFKILYIHLHIYQSWDPICVNGEISGSIIHDWSWDELDMADDPPIVLQSCDNYQAFKLPEGSRGYLKAHCLHWRGSKNRYGPK